MYSITSKSSLTVIENVKKEIEKKGIKEVSCVLVNLLPSSDSQSSVHMYINPLGARSFSGVSQSKVTKYDTLVKLN